MMNQDYLKKVTKGHNKRDVEVNMKLVSVLRNIKQRLDSLLNVFKLLINIHFLELAVRDLFKNFNFHIQNNSTGNLSSYNFRISMVN